MIMMWKNPCFKTFFPRPPLPRPGELAPRAVRSVSREEGAGRAVRRQPSLRGPKPREELETQWRQLSASMTCLQVGRCGMVWLGFVLIGMFSKVSYSMVWSSVALCRVAR